MARISWTSQAFDDLQAINNFIARDVPTYAQVLIDKILDAVERLENFPRSGRIVQEINEENVRELIVGSYRVVYLLTGDEVNILTVFHASRLLKSSDLQKINDAE